LQSAREPCARSEKNYGINYCAKGRKNVEKQSNKYHAWIFGEVRGGNDFSKYNVHAEWSPADEKSADNPDENLHHNPVLI